MLCLSVRSELVDRWKMDSYSSMNFDPQMKSIWPAWSAVYCVHSKYKRVKQSRYTFLGPILYETWLPQDWNLPEQLVVSGREVFFTHKLQLNCSPTSWGYNVILKRWLSKSPSACLNLKGTCPVVCFLFPVTAFDNPVWCSLTQFAGSNKKILTYLEFFCDFR